MFEKIISWIVLVVFGLLILKTLSLIIIISIIEGYRKKKWNSFVNSTLSTTTWWESKKRVKSSFFKKVLSGLYFGSLRYFIYKLGLVPSNRIRLFFYRHTLHMNIGKRVIIHFRAEIRDGCKISISDNSIIGDNCLLDGRSGLIIGKNVNFSSNASVYTLEHDKDDVLFGPKGGKVIIDDWAWISANSIVLPNIHIGKGAVVCGGAVVTKSVDDFSVVGGVPAKKIGERNNAVDYEFNGNSDWFL